VRIGRRELYRDSAARECPTTALREKTGTVQMIVFPLETGGLCAIVPSLAGRLWVHLPPATLKCLGAGKQPANQFDVLSQNLVQVHEAALRVGARCAVREFTLQPWHLHPRAPAEGAPQVRRDPPTPSRCSEGFGAATSPTHASLLRSKQDA
jgi:hypothetical protein